MLLVIKRRKKRNTYFLRHFWFLFALFVAFMGAQAYYFVAI